MQNGFIHCRADDVYIVERVASLEKYAVVGSTSQRNVIYFMRHLLAHNGRSAKFIAAAEKGTLATLDGRAIAERGKPWAKYLLGIASM